MKHFLFALLLIGVGHLPLSLHALEPRIVKPTLDDSEVVVADLVLTDAPYSADPTGAKDNTSILQKAIDELKAAGGGVIYIPAGIYRFNGGVRMPGGISLRGDWKSPLEGGSGKGTILAVYGGRGQADGAPFILVTSGESAVRNLSFWYPEQSIEDVQPYPPTVSRAYMAVLYYNLTFYNAYEGMSCVHAGGMPTHENIYGTFLKRGIFNDKNLEYGFIDRLYISPSIWADAPSEVIRNAPKKDRAKLYDYCLSHTDGVFLGDADNILLYDITIEVAKTGIRYDRSILPARAGKPIHSLAPYGLQMKINVKRDVRYLSPYVGDFPNLDDHPGLNDIHYSQAPMGRPARRDVLINARKEPWAARGDGKTDDTEAIQKALDHAKEQGGGIVYLAAGEYVVRQRLTIPTGVELRGAYDFAHRSGSTGAGVTALFAYEGDNAENSEELPAFISMEEKSGLVGLVILYPEQNDFFPTVEAAPPKRYPWTVRGLGKNIYLRYVTIKRGWDLIDLGSHDCSGFSMRGLWTSPLNRGIFIGGGTDGGRMEKIIQTMGAWGYPGRNTPNVPEWTRELQQEWVWTHANDYFFNNVKGYHFGDVKNVQGFGVISFHLKHHMIFLSQNGKGPQNMDFFLSPSEGTGGACTTYEAGDNIRFYGLGCGKTVASTSDDFKGQVDIYGLMSWYGRQLPEIRGGTVNIHPQAPPGTTVLSVTPDNSDGLIKRPNYLKLKPEDTLATIQGKKCWILSVHEKNPNVAFLDLWVAYDQWRFGRIPEVEIRIEYLDKGKGTIQVIYDAKENPEKKLATIKLSDSGSWKTWTGQVEDALFGRSIAKPYRNNDLFLGVRTSQPLAISRVELRRKKGE